MFFYLTSVRGHAVESIHMPFSGPDVMNFRRLANKRVVTWMQKTTRIHRQTIFYGGHVGSDKISSQSSRRSDYHPQMVILVCELKEKGIADADHAATDLGGNLLDYRRPYLDE